MPVHARGQGPEGSDGAAVRGGVWTRKDEADSLEQACSLMCVLVLAVLGGLEGEPVTNESFGALETLSGAKARLSESCLHQQLMINAGKGRQRYDEPTKAL